MTSWRWTWARALVLGIAGLGAVAAASGAVVWAVPKVQSRLGVCTIRQINFDRVQIESIDLGHQLFVLQAANTELINSNIVALALPEGTLLIDPGHPELIGKVMRALGQIDGGRVEFVVNTHSHADHACANGAYWRRGAVVLAQKETAVRIADFPRLQSPNGYQDVPVTTFDERLDLAFGGRTIQLEHIPHAHTDGDAIIVFPVANVIATGDIYSGYGYSFIGVEQGGSIDGLIAGLERLLALSNAETRFVPGHGEIVGRAEIERQLALLRDMRARVAAHKAAGVPLEAMLEQAPLADLDARLPRHEYLNGRNMATWIYDSLP